MSIPPKLNAERQELKIRSINIYKNDVRVVREPARKRMHDRTPVWLMDVDGSVITNQGLRDGKVKQFSRKSRQKLAFVAQNTDAKFDRMITLTYPKVYPQSGKIVKRQLNTILQWLRRRNVANYLWFMEFQKRGAPHFHILLQGGEYIDKSDLGNRWFEIVGSGDDAHLLAGTRIEKGRKAGGLHRYAVKYATKLYQKNVPEEFSDVGRLWGCSKSVSPKPKARIKVDCEASLSALLKNWEYSGEEEKGYSILFNASRAVLELLNSLGIPIDRVGGSKDKENGQENT